MTGCVKNTQLENNFAECFEALMQRARYQIATPA